MEEIPLSQLESFIETRLDYQDIEEIANSFSNIGQLSPILVRLHPDGGGKYQVVYGNRRLEAAKMLGWKTIKCTISQMSDGEAMVKAFCENVDRRNLSDYEIALFLERLHLSSGKTYTELSDLVKKSKAFVSQHVAMLHLFPTNVATEQERTRVLRALTERHARALTRIENAEERWNTAKLTVSAGFGVREIEKICASLSRERPVEITRNQKAVIQTVVEKVFSQFRQKDPSSHFQIMSEGFTMLARFQPFHEMGKDEAEDFLCKFLRVTDGLKARLDSISCRFIGNICIATVFATYVLTGPEKEKLTSKNRTTIVLQRDDHNWKVVHEHWSSADGKEQFGDLIEKLQALTASYQETKHMKLTN